MPAGDKDSWENLSKEERKKREQEVDAFIEHVEGDPAGWLRDMEIIAGSYRKAAEAKERGRARVEEFENMTPEEEDEALEAMLLADIQRIETIRERCRAKGWPEEKIEAALCETDPEKIKALHREIGLP